jgi:thioredoxin-related protein
MKRFLSMASLAAAAFALVIATGASAQENEKGNARGYEAKVGDDGLHVQPWFLNTFLDLRDDLKEAASQGKRLAIIWEQRGCPYCREMHRVNLARPEIADYIKKHFNVIQLNMWGDREVTDFDGKVMSEKNIARKFRVVFTPTIQFFPATPGEVAGKSAADAEVMRLPGYFKPFHFVSMFEYVYVKGYETQPFQRWLQDKARKMQAEGKEVELW